MKSIFFTIIALLFTTICYAQDTVERKNRLTDSVIERFYVRKENDKINQGPYKAFFKRRTLIATGNYNNNKRIGLWHFYSTKGRLIEKFNYDANKLTYEAALDTNTDLSFLFDDKIVKTDTVTRPLKIGGSYYGFIPYVNAFQVPFDTMYINTDYFEATVELLISPGGRLADFKIYIKSDSYRYTHVFSLSPGLFSQADQTFIPATINKKAVLSRIIIKCDVTGSGRLDFN